MEDEFDKEIDSLLRRTARGEAVRVAENPSAAHLDADEISAFAENALPEKARQNYILHFADCEKCRKNLAAVITLNHETPNEIIPAQELNLAAAAAAAKIPWYQKFFAVPTFAYALGALILLFAGVGIFTILQRNSTNSQVSQVSEKQIGGGGAAAILEDDSNAAISNSAANSNAAISKDAAAPLSAANANVLTARRDSNAVSNAASNEGAANDRTPRKSIESPENLSSVPAPPPPPQVEELPLNGRNFEQISPSTTDDVTTQNRTTQNQSQTMPDTRGVQNAPMAAPQARMRQNDSVELSKREQEKSAETKIVAGKTFNRTKNIWIDAAYRGQTTTNVKRGTDEYKKLDSGLRNIFENIGGVLIIVWKDKAYQIQ